MPFAKPNKSRVIVGGVIIACLSLVVVGLIYSFEGKDRLEHDTAQAIIGARYLNQGQGYVTDCPYYPEHYIAETLPAPQTVFPPGMPLAIAGLTRLSVPPIRAAFLLSLIAFALLPISIFVMCLKSGLRVAVAVVASMVWIAFVNVWENAYRIQFDVIFYLFTVLSTVFLARTNRRPILMAFIAGCLAAAALMVRYAALFFMTAAALAIAIDWFRRRSKTAFSELIAFCIPTGITVLVIGYRNFKYVGDPKGGNSYNPGQPAIESIRDLYLAFVNLTGISHAKLTDLNPVEYFAVATIVVGFIQLWRHKGSLKLNRPLFSAAVENRIPMVCLFYAILSNSLLVWMTFSSCLGVEARMFLASGPFVLMLVGMVTQVVDTGIVQHRFRLFAHLGIFTLLLGQVAIADQVFVEASMYPNLVVAGEAKVDDTNLRTFLRERLSLQHPLIANESQIVGQYLERPVLGLAEPRYVPTVWTAETVIEMVKRFNVEWVIVLDGLDYEVRVPFFESLDTPPDWLQLYATGPKFKLFRVVGVSD